MASDMNDVWLAARRAFDATTRPRRHYVALHDGGTAIAYGAIEQDVGAPTYRLFVVTASSRRNDGTDALLGWLLHDFRSVKAGRTWMREEARDPFLAFATALDETSRRRYERGDTEIVELEMALSGQ
jgi:hypothetical protein